MEDHSSDVPSHIFYGPFSLTTYRNNIYLFNKFVLTIIVEPFIFKKKKEKIIHPLTALQQVLTSHDDLSQI